MIDKHDEVARTTGAVCVVHCGNDCIPWDLAVFEMHQLAKSNGAELVEASTFTELPPAFAASGGTLTTAVYQLGKKRSDSKPAFDPLLRRPDGSKSEFATKIASPKKDTYFKEFDKQAGPWIMSPVMANCVRRSNALLGYSKEFTYSEAQLRSPDTWQWVKDTAFSALVGAAVYLPAVFSPLLPQPGEGPSREAMEKGWLVVQCRGRAVKSASKEEVKLTGQLRFEEDTGYLCTARMLVESAMLLLKPERPGGVMTPAAAFGSEGMQRVLAELPATWELALEK